MIAIGRRPVEESAFVRWCPLDLSAPQDADLRALGCAEALVHLAWEGLPNYRAARHLEMELPRQTAFVDAALAAGVKRLVVAGTCLEYGMQEGELHEGLEPRPTNAYGQAKDLLRRYAEVASLRHGASLVWARLFYLHGEGQAPTAIWSQLADHVRRGEESFPMSGGQQVRDFMPVIGAAEALVSLATTRNATGTFNVCSGKPRTLEQVVRSWLADRRWGIRLELGRLPYADYEPFAFWGSRERLDRCLAVGAPDGQSEFHHRR